MNSLVNVRRRRRNYPPHLGLLTRSYLKSTTHPPRQTQDPKVLILTQNFFPPPRRQIKENETRIVQLKWRRLSSHAGQFDQPPANSVIMVTYPAVEDMFLLSFSFVKFVWRRLMIFPIQAKLDSAVLSLTASTLVEPRPSLLKGAQNNCPSFSK